MTHAVASLNTKRTLANSLRKAMEKKPFSKVTVTEIIKDSGVNRKTFYYHFQDIYSLLKWMVQQDAVDVVKNFDIESDFGKAIVFVMNYVEQNSHLVFCAYDSVGHDVVKSFFYDDFIELMKKYIIINERKHNLVLNERYRAFLSRFYTEALSGMLMDWIKDKESVDKQYVADVISKTILSSLNGIFDDYKSLS